MTATETPMRMTVSQAAKAMAHPLRVSVLSALAPGAKVGGVVISAPNGRLRVASPSDLAEELKAPLGNVSYHVRILVSLGALKLVKKRPRRGAIEHYYALTADGVRLLERTPSWLRRKTGSGDYSVVVADNDGGGHLAAGSVSDPADFIDTAIAEYPDVEAFDVVISRV